MRYAVARQRLSQWLAFGLSLLAMISRPSVALNSSEFRYATLPKQYQLALDAFRDKPDSRCAALEADAFTREEDACILHNVLLIGKQGTWKHMVPGRTEKASKGRYHKILKKHVVAPRYTVPERRSFGAIRACAHGRAVPGVTPGGARATTRATPTFNQPGRAHVKGSIGFRLFVTALVFVILTDLSAAVLG